MSKKIFDWKETCRYYLLEIKENEAGNFLSCSIIEGEGKRQRIFIPKWRGLIKG